MTECQDPRNSAPWVCGKCGPCLEGKEERDLRSIARTIRNGGTRLGLNTAEALEAAADSLTSLEAEKERLREALTEIANAEPSDHQTAAADWRDLRGIARQSLNHPESIKEKTP